MLSCFSHVQLFVTPWTVARQAPLSVGFSRQEYWNGLPCPPPGDFPDPEIEPTSLMSPALAGVFFTTNATWEAPKRIIDANILLQIIKSKSNPKLDIIRLILGFPGGSAGKESPCNAEDLGLNPGLRRSPGEGNGYPL